jgi:hypothetical protein
MQIIGNDISYCSKKVEEFQNFFNREAHQFWKGLVRLWELSQGDEKHSELPAERQLIAVINNDWKPLYHRLYCEIIDTMKGQLASRLSEILKLKFVSLPDFGNFKHYSEKFPLTVYESLLKLHGRYLDYLLLETELSVIYLNRKSF